MNDKSCSLCDCLYGCLSCSETSNLMVVIWDDSFAKLEQLFIIFGVVLLVAVFLSVCVFCSSLFVS